MPAERRGRSGLRVRLGCGGLDQVTGADAEPLGQCRDRERGAAGDALLWSAPGRAT